MILQLSEGNKNKRSLIDRIVYSTRSSSSSTTGRLLISPMPQRNDSLSSSNPSSFAEERNQGIGKITGQLQPPSNYHIDEQESKIYSFFTSVETRNDRFFF